MISARICEKYDMWLPDPTPGDPWFVDWALRSPRQAGQHLTAGWHAYQSIKDLEINTAVEYFGGVGAQTLMISDLFAPVVHDVFDISPSAAEHLLHLDVASAECVDAYDPAQTTKADLVGLDFGDLTIWKASQPGKHRDLLERVFLLEPKAVVLTDVAGPHLHLHRERYETVLGAGSCADYPSYLRAFAEYIDETWGYRLVAGYWHRWSTVMALVPAAQQHDEVSTLITTPDSPVGLEIR